MTLEQILPTHIDVRLSKEHNKPVLGIGRNENGNFVLTILSLNDEKISITAEVDATQLAYFLRVAEFVLDKELNGSTASCVCSSVLIDTK